MQQVILTFAIMCNMRQWWLKIIRRYEAAETPTLRSVLQPRALMVTVYVYAAERLILSKGSSINFSCLWCTPSMKMWHC